MKIFLHVGAGKCASSSIQQHFSYNNIQGKFAYGAIDHKNGNIHIGKELYAKALKSPLDYRCSCEDIFLYPENLEKSLAECARKFDTLLLSYEGWSGSINKFNKNNDILKKYDVEVIFIVRPYVQWYNSAWWQWLNWGRDTELVDDYIAKDTDIFTKNHSGGGVHGLKII